MPRDGLLTTAAYAVVPLVGRGRLTSALLHGQPLYVHAARAAVSALGPGAQVQVLADWTDVSGAAGHLRDADVGAEVVRSGHWRPAPGRLVVHDPLCPLTPVTFLQELARTEPDDAAVVAYRPVTDTIKTVVEEMIAGTVDRERLAALTSPAVFTLGHSLEADADPPLTDFGALLGWLRQRGPVRLVRSPAMARRVDDESAINLLECVDELGHQLSPG